LEAANIKKGDINSWRKSSEINKKYPSGTGADKFIPGSLRRTVESKGAVPTLVTHSAGDKIFVLKGDIRYSVHILPAH